MFPADRETLLGRLLAGDLTAPEGLAECEWLDVKDGIYPLGQQPRAADELAKDTAAFANSRGGGLLLVGYKTRVEHKTEIVDILNPIPRDRVDVNRYRDTIRERVAPFIRDLSVLWLPMGADASTGVLLIHVPPQESRPFVVRGTGTFVAVPVRDGDGTRWLSPQELQSLLALGWRTGGGPPPRPQRHPGDIEKTARVLAALPPAGGWIQRLGNVPTLKRIPDTLSSDLFAAETALESDRIHYVDNEVASSHADLMAALQQLSHHVQDMHAPLTGGDYSEVPPEWQSTPEGRRRYTDLRNALDDARDNFLRTFAELLNLLNRKGLLPTAQEASVRI